MRDVNEEEERRRKKKEKGKEECAPRKFRVRALRVPAPEAAATSKQRATGAPEEKHIARVTSFALHRSTQA